MNSWSRNNYEPWKREERCEERHEHCRKEERCEEKRHEEKECKTFVKCGSPNSTIIPEIEENSTMNRNFTLATLTLDTSCICDPKIKLDFTSNIIANGPAALNIQIFKQCRHQFNPVAIGSTWAFRVPSANHSQTFSFFVCDSDSCDGECCTYTAVATVTSEELEQPLSINNATLAATVTCGENECRKKCHRRHDN